MEITNMSRVRALHAAANAPAFDVLFDRSPAVATPYLITNLPYGDISRYVPIAPGRHSLRLFRAAGERQAQELFVAEIPEALRPGEDYTLAVVGNVPRYDVTLLHDATVAPLPGTVKIRFLHASPDAPTVDIATPGGRPLFLGVHFNSATLFREAPAGSTALEVRPAGHTAPIYTIPNVTFEAGTFYTLVAMGLLRGTPAFKVISVADVVRVPVPM